MNNAPTMPTPMHGDKQTTDKGNLLVCIQLRGQQKKFFYMTPDGKYRPHPFSIKNKQFLNNAEWKFMYNLTQKSEQMTPAELAIAEELYAYINQDVTACWDVEEIKKGLSSLADDSVRKNGLASARGFANIAKLFAE